MIGHVTPSLNPSVRAAVRHLDAPFVVLDLDAALANARDLSTRAGSTPIRLASKSLRIPELMRRVLALPGYRGILGYTLAEACWLVETGVTDDVLVAYPTSQRRDLRRLLAIPELRRSITLTVDSVAHLDLIDEVRRELGRAGGHLAAPGADADAADAAAAGSQAAVQEAAEVRICIDMDASYRIETGTPAATPRADAGAAQRLSGTLRNAARRLGVRPVHIGALRSPLRTPEDLAEFARTVALRPGFRVVGLLAYEGQIAGTADTSPAIAAMKRLSTREIATRRAAAVSAIGEALASAGAPALEFVNGGGTGSIETTSAEPVVTEIGAGSGVIGPALFDRYRHFRPRPAEWFVLPVCRFPGPGIATVAGGGRIASGPAGQDRLPMVDYPQGLSLARLEGPGEVQTPLLGPAADTLALGDHVWFRHAKAGEGAEHATTVVVVSGGRIIDTWPTYRGEGRIFA